MQRIDLVNNKNHISYFSVNDVNYSYGRNIWPYLHTLWSIQSQVDNDKHRCAWGPKHFELALKNV